MKVIYGYSYFASEYYDDAKKMTEEYVDRLNQQGFDVIPYCLTLNPPGGPLSFSELDKKWREKEVWENAKEFWTPIFEQTDFPTYIEKKYSFKHNSIFSDITKTGEE